MLGVISLVDAGTWSFNKLYVRSIVQISAFAGDGFVFERGGDHGVDETQSTGDIVSPLVQKIDHLSAGWESDFPESRVQQDLRIKQSFKLLEEFELKQDDLPCLVYITPSEKMVGILRIRRRWFETEYSWKIFLRQLCLWHENVDVRNLAAANLEDGEIASQLSRLLQELTHAVNVHLQSLEVDTRETTRSQTPPGFYCQVITENGIENLTRAEYAQLVTQKSDFDMFIDGLTRQVSRRDANGSSHYSKLTPRELNILIQYTNHSDPMRPRDTSAGRLCTSLRAANNLFERARRKVDIAITRYEYRSFQLVRHPRGTEHRMYRFDPPSSLKYRIILSP